MQPFNGDAVVRVYCWYTVYYNLSLTIIPLDGKIQQKAKMGKMGRFAWRLAEEPCLMQNCIVNS